MNVVTAAVSCTVLLYLCQFIILSDLCSAVRTLENVGASALLCLLSNWFSLSCFNVEFVLRPACCDSDWTFPRHHGERRW